MNDEREDEATDELAPHVEPGDAAGIEAMASQLEQDRPVPRAGFRSQLRARLVELDRGPKRIPVGRLRLLIASYSIAGAACLALAALSLTGAGPLAP